MGEVEAGGWESLGAIADRVVILRGWGTARFSRVHSGRLVIFRKGDIEIRGVTKTP